MNAHEAEVREVHANAEVLDQLADKLPNWAWKINYEKDLVIIGSLELRRRFGPLSDVDILLIHQRIFTLLSKFTLSDLRRKRGRSKFDSQRMLDNAASASQARQLLEPATRGAVLRSVGQWLNHNGDLSGPELLDLIKEDPEYDK
jgi:hypothetical protein